MLRFYQENRFLRAVVALDVIFTLVSTWLMKSLGMLGVETIVYDKRRGSLQCKDILMCKYFSSVRNGILMSLLFKFFFFTISILVTSCEEGSTSNDECGQRCTCDGGQLVNCVRIRKEFTSLTTAERKRHIETILEVSAQGSIYRAEYEQLINEHYQLFSTGIHRKEHFLPWHRYFILRYENLMRKADCTFTATYWDWSLDSREPFSTGVDNVWNSDTGFGGDGVDADQNCVLDGPFRKGAWSRVRPDNARRGPDCLMRSFNGNPPEEIDVMTVLNMNDFTEFELTLRVELHDNVHCQIGATMCSREAASAPEFFLHHAFIDKIWDDWQKKSSAHKDAYFPTVEEDMPQTNLRPAQLIDLSNQPGGVRVEYEPFKPAEVIRKKVKGKKTLLYASRTLYCRHFLVNEYPNNVLRFSFPFFPSLLFFSFPLFFFLSSLIPPLNF